ncbi:PDDEXK nuclease domain-containing protein [Capnocytophaga sp. ARDL2]|uniref:PDDEXK nuclease domain-containing protein n=1 Tax=Capnocytophaga sp. ARDL2 TaxID=3238809 RepID=UPI003557AA75
MGKGFAFVGKQVELKMNEDKSYFLDMLFYHIRLKCYVVIELKVVDFEPKFVGKLNFYVTATDKLLKNDDDNLTIGLLICKTKDNTIVEWAFQDIKKPLSVSTFQLQQQIPKELETDLPSIEEIEREIGFV